MNLKTYLLGVFEISLFMKIGLDRFSGDLNSFLRSFYVLFLNIALIPISIPYLYAVDPNLQNMSLNSIIIIFIVKFILVIALLVTLSYYLCKFLKRQEYFVKYITVSNWASLIAVILYLPFIIMMAVGTYSFSDLAPYLILVSIYMYSLAGFIAKYVLQIPWELAAFIAILSMAINESSFELVYLVTG